MKKYKIRIIGPQDKEWIRKFIKEQWHDEFVVVHGQIFYPVDLSGFVAVDGNNYYGLITYNIERDKCEIVTLNSILENHGIGTNLIQKVIRIAQEIDCSRVWLITTNDNVPAIKFYQKRGFKIVAVHNNAVEKSRELKPSIPLVADNGIVINDEIEFEYRI